MSEWLALPVGAPLLAAGLSILARRQLGVQRIVGFATVVGVLVYAVALVGRTAQGEVLASRIGDWPAPFAITFAADTFSALMVLIASSMVIACMAFAAAAGEDEVMLFYPLSLVLTAGVCGAFLTADLFNMFVFFEVMLIASYVLLTIDGTWAQVRGGAVYVATNLFASTLFLIGIAFMYGATGSVNMAQLAGLDLSSAGAVVAGALLFVAFGIKGSLAPVHGWLPSAYPRARRGVAALFSGLLTKVGIYALFRVVAIVYDGDPRFLPVLLLAAGTTMVVGVMGAIGRTTMREILSFHIVSQVGYMVMGLALFTSLGLAGGIFYILHHIIVKTSLFLSAGAVETLEGTGRIDHLGGLARRYPIVAVAFMVSALSLAGVPPLSGFVAKLTLVRAAFDQSSFAIAGVAVAVSFFTLFSMVKIWNGVFWGETVSSAVGVRRAQQVVAVGGGSRVSTVAVAAPALALAIAAVMIGVWPEPLLVLSRAAADSLIDASGYVRAVLGS